MTKNKKRLHRIDKLRTAIKNLASFANQEGTIVPHVQDFEVDNEQLVNASKSPLKKNIDLICQFIGSAFSSKIRKEQNIKRKKIQKTLLNSIDLVKTLSIDCRHIGNG